MQGYRVLVVGSVVAMLATSCGSQDAGATTSTAPSCAEITGFAERIVDVGIVYNYEPSRSPGALAASHEVVFAGVLTGGFEDGEVDESSRGDEFVSFEIEVTKVAAGGESLDMGDKVYVSLDYSAASVAPEEFEQAIAVDAPVVVFASSDRDGRGLVASPTEGFMTACEDAGPIGLRGRSGAWAGIGSLDEVLRLAG